MHAVGADDEQLDAFLLALESSSSTASPVSSFVSDGQDSWLLFEPDSGTRILHAPNHRDRLFERIGARALRADDATVGLETLCGQQDVPAVVRSEWSTQ